jgi:CMP-N,N'-diacetyllegionaminic acid synthase
MSTAPGGVLAIVPARGGSKGVPGKNVREIRPGRTLLHYVADAAKNAVRVDRVVLSTEDEDIARVGREAGLDVPFMRPRELAADDTPMLPVLRHAIDHVIAGGWTPEYVVLLQPTSPLRREKHIDDAVSLLMARGADSVVTVVEVPKHLSPDYVMKIEDGALRPFLPEGTRITRRQDVRPAYYRDGTVYAFRRDTIDRFQNIYGERCVPLRLEARESLSIDTPEDWAAAERILAAHTAESAGQAQWPESR